MGATDINTFCTWTKDTATETELRDLFSMDEDDGDLEDVVATHSGEWRHDGNGCWRWWQLPEELELSVAHVTMTEPRHDQ